MYRRYSVVAALAVTVSLSQALLAADAPAASPQAKAATVDKHTATREALRDLWNDHIFYVRNVVVATKDTNPDARKAAEAQVVANAKAIAGSIEPFYGKQASDQLFKLLAGHWGAIKAYLDATDTHNQAGMDQAQKDLYANAQSIANFLSGANPNWTKNVVDGMLMGHAAHHIMQIQDIYAGRYDKEAAQDWPEMRKNMNMLGDALADGLAKQFPDKF
jgi:hypothetical protein